jgi:hypothetical protein
VATETEAEEAMSPPAFDLRLWLICTALASGAFAVPTAITFITGRESVASLAVSFVVSVFLGFLLQGPGRAGRGPQAPGQARRHLDQPERHHNYGR